MSCGCIVQGAPCPAKSRDQNFCCPFANVYEEGNPGWGRFSQFPTHENMRLFLWDYRNPAVSDYLVQTRILGKLGLGSPWVDGFFTDDPDGLGEEHPLVLTRIGYGAGEVTECRTAQTKALRRSQEAVVAHGGFTWQLFTQENAVTNETRTYSPRTLRSVPGAPCRHCPSRYRVPHSGGTRAA